MDSCERSNVLARLARANFDVKFKSARLAAAAFRKSNVSRQFNFNSTRCRRIWRSLVYFTGRSIPSLFSETRYREIARIAKGGNSGDWIARAREREDLGVTCSCDTRTQLHNLHITRVGLCARVTLDGHTYTHTCTRARARAYICHNRRRHVNLVHGVPSLESNSRIF